VTIHNFDHVSNQFSRASFSRSVEALLSTTQNCSLVTRCFAPRSGEMHDSEATLFFRAMTRAAHTTLQSVPNAKHSLEKWVVWRRKRALAHQRAGLQVHPESPRRPQRLFHT
jgi:hypothetical protein